MARSRSSRRALALAASILALAAATPACVSSLRTGLAGGDGAPPAEREGSALLRYWRAVSHLELMRATRIAPEREHADFARGMRLVLDGRMDEAEARFAPLATEASDSLVRAASRVALSSVLGYAGDWEALHRLASSSTRHSGGASLGRAGIDSWSAALHTAPAAEYSVAAIPAVLRFEVTGTGTPLLTVLLNGRERYFWLDTGTSLTLVAEDVAAEAGLRPLVDDTLEIVTTVGRITARPAVVQELAVGPLAATNHIAAIVPARDLTITMFAEGGRRERVKVDGVIGMDLIRRLNVVIDFPTQVAILSRPRAEDDAGRDRNLYWLGYPVVRAEGPKGVPLFFGLDTGADSTYVTQGLLRKLPRRLLAKRTQYVSGFGADTTVRTPILSDLRLKAAGRDFYLRNVVVADSRRLMFFELDGILAADLGAGHRVRIDMTNGIFQIGTPKEKPIEVRVRE